MYHHFDSKKAMIIAMLGERLIPKVRDFFDFDDTKESNIINILTNTFEKMSKNKMLIKYGCPLHKLMFEMGSRDSDISQICNREFEHISSTLQIILEKSMQNGEIKRKNSKSLADFIMISTWGALSRDPEYSSKEQFLQDTQHLINYIR